MLNIVADDGAGTENRPKSEEIDSRPKSMMPGNPSGALMAELTSHSKKSPAPPRPLNNVSEDGDKSTDSPINNKDSDKEEQKSDGTTTEIYL